MAMTITQEQFNQLRSASAALYAPKVTASTSRSVSTPSTSASDNQVDPTTAVYDAAATKASAADAAKMGTQLSTTDQQLYNVPAGTTYGEVQGQTPLGSTERALKNGKDSLSNIIDNVERASKNVNTVSVKDKNRLDWFIQGAKNKIATVDQFAPNAADAHDVHSAAENFAILLYKQLGGTGRPPSDLVSSYSHLFPTIYDTKEEAANKITNLRNELASGKLPTGSTQVATQQTQTAQPSTTQDMTSYRSKYGY